MAYYKPNREILSTKRSKKQKELMESTGRRCKRTIMKTTGWSKLVKKQTPKLSQPIKEIQIRAILSMKRRTYRMKTRMITMNMMKMRQICSLEGMSQTNVSLMPTTMFMVIITIVMEGISWKSMPTTCSWRP